MPRLLPDAVAVSKLLACRLVLNPFVHLPFKMGNELPKATISQFDRCRWRWSLGTLTAGCAHFINRYFMHSVLLQVFSISLARQKVGRGNRPEVENTEDQAVNENLAPFLH